eukprot:1594768-Amphidinium_carterae.2
MASWITMRASSYDKRTEVHDPHGAGLTPFIHASWRRAVLSKGCNPPVKLSAQNVSDFISDGLDVAFLHMKQVWREWRSLEKPLPLRNQVARHISPRTTSRQASPPPSPPGLDGREKLANSAPHCALHHRVRNPAGS